MDYVYVMYRHDKGLYKIGHSANPFDRMRSVKSQKERRKLINKKIEDC